MKTVDFKNMTTAELNEKLKALKVELFNLRFQHATGQLTNPMMLNTTKKDIAKLERERTCWQESVRRNRKWKNAMKEDKEQELLFQTKWTKQLLLP